VELDEVYVIAVPLLLDETLLDDDLTLALDILCFYRDRCFNYVRPKLQDQSIKSWDGLSFLLPQTGQDRRLKMVQLSQFNSYLA